MTEKKDKEPKQPIFKEKQDTKPVRGEWSLGRVATIGGVSLALAAGGGVALSLWTQDVVSQAGKSDTVTVPSPADSDGFYKISDCLPLPQQTLVWNCLATRDGNRPFQAVVTKINGGWIFAAGDKQASLHTSPGEITDVSVHNRWKYDCHARAVAQEGSTSKRPVIQASVVCNFETVPKT